MARQLWLLHSHGAVWEASIVVKGVPSDQG
jgi:hypothetical protein